MIKLSKFYKVAIFIISTAIAYLYFFEQPSTFKFKIHKVKIFNEIESHFKNIKKNTLVVFDVDDVLITSPDIFARGNHFPWQFRIKLFFKYPSLLFSENWEYIYSLLWKEAPRYLLDPKIPQIISSLKNKHIPVVLLTSMESESYGVIKNFPEWRYKMLKNFGIDLKGQFSNKIFKSFPKYRGNYPVLYNGILCANQQNKGAVLNEFLKFNKINPTHIIFIDDGVKNLNDVGNSCLKNNINYTLINYIGANSLSSSFDIDKALQQIDHLFKTKTWKSDYELSQNNEYLPTPYSYKLDKKIHKLTGSKPPYISLFSTSKTKIIYLATNHTNDIKSKTFAWIRTVINNFKPNLIIFEGVVSSNGYSPQNIIHSINKKNSPSNWVSGEHLYAAYFGNNNNIPFLGGEADEQIIFNRLKKYGYSTDDIIFFYFSKQIPQLYREKLISKQEDLKLAFPDFIKRLINKSKSKILNVSSYFEKYKIWINKHIGKSEETFNVFDFKTLINSNNTAPISKGNFLQKLSSRIGIIRDKHIINVISNNSHKFDKILVVYGASHLSTQYGVLSKIFGHANFFVNIEDYKDTFISK